MLEHGVEHGQQFPHAGDERHLLGFAHSTQALIERLDCRVVPCRHDGRHIQGGPDLCASAPYHPFPVQRAAVTIERGHADKRGHLFVRQRAQFR